MSDTTTTKPGDWMKSTAWLANIGHFLAGACVAFVFHEFDAPLLLAEVCFVLAVLTKEYLIDLHFESDEYVKSSTVDAVGYFLGHGAAWGLVALAHAMGRS